MLGQRKAERTQVRHQQIETPRPENEDVGCSALLRASGQLIQAKLLQLDVNSERDCLSQRQEQSTSDRRLLWVDESVGSRLVRRMTAVVL